MSTPPLFFVDHLPAAPTLRLGGEEGHHAARVRRLALGEAVYVADGLGGVADCLVAGIRADGLDLTVLDWRTLPLPDPYVTVVQAVPKGDRAELAIELMTELGVDEVVPWVAARSVAQWRDGRAARALDKWRRTAREAAKQSRRPRVPVITESATTAQVAARLAGLAPLAGGCGLVLHEGARDRLATVDLPAKGHIVIVVGPEGGISEQECDAFRAAGARTVRMGEPVMRTSTAGAASLAALSVRLGRWGSPARVR
ncbi:MAG: 16S rRNA (uracil(1498)-N(3))-methyltransferase [Actinomycetota bacterium]|nr:16S rRNA (uracil(1498)-N(3))-methyltransferase [Actinomycetota bacterium]